MVETAHHFPLCPVVLVGPSGSGKSTLITKLMKEFPGVFAFSISHTTRQPRAGEADGVHYHFTTREQMEKEIVEGLFIESSEFSGNLYGTSKRALQSIVENGRVPLMDLDTVGIELLAKAKIPFVHVFISPPSFEELTTRLVARGDKSDAIAKRLETAKHEMEIMAKPENTHLVLVNDNVDVCYDSLKSKLITLRP
eukprot:TRINITY_DN4920_c1_g1_i1.p1 TRINITY_DN4920_c1_g1~~TRINITY_DN4920_c1_g1_i1.p1  ORF type:complete len:210 (+),score=91.01 TRINITY_DN4920_c1_g1_i1:44-631(+)